MALKALDLPSLFRPDPPEKETVQVRESLRDALVKWFLMSLGSLEVFRKYQPIFCYGASMLILKGFILCMFGVLDRCGCR